MKKILTVLSLFLITSISAQNLSAPLPVDSSIKKGVLSNGMTYYLHSTDVTKDVASYYIIQNVGSVLEEDNQQGLAHFLEHMAFNGTENFKGKGILNTLEKEGIVFGKDINAYTSFDETVYNVDNVPTTPKLIDTGLQILHDWSNYLLLTEEEIDAERGVIKEEWRTRQNGQMRILESTIGAMFGHSVYSKRLPIGLMDIVENFEYKALRDFYHNWYRTDLQAIAIVGDFDVAEMEAKIKSKFSAIPAIKNGPKRFNIKIDDNQALDYAIGMDDEVSTASIQFGIRHNNSLANETVADLKESLLNGIISSILRERFSNITQNPDAPFIGVRAGYSNATRLHNAFNIQITPKEGKQQEAFKLAMQEINRAVKFGFTNAEINRVLVSYKSGYENQIAKLEDRSHKQIIKIIQSNYLDNNTIGDLAKEYEIAKQILNHITQEDLLKQIQKLYTKKNRSLIVTGVKGKNNLTKNQAISILNEVENSTTLKPYKEEEALKPLMAGVNLTPGKIINKEINKTLGFTTYTLSNNVKVHFQFVNKDKNKVSMLVHSYGGTSLLPLEDMPSASILGNVVSMSGLGEFSATELPKVLAGKQANVNFKISGLSETISGGSTTKDVETMLKLANLRFTKPRFDKTAYNVFMQNVDNYLVRKSQDLKSKMSDSLTVTLYGENNPRKPLFNKSYIQKFSLDKVEDIYRSRFANIGDFQVFISGDVTAEHLEPLLEKYIASIPATKEKENWKDNSVSWIRDNTDKDIYLPMQDAKTSVKIAIKNEMPYNLKNAYLMSILGDILTLRYTQSLREEEGGTYGARSSGALSKKPVSIASLGVSFDCNPDLAEKLISIVYKEIDLIKNGTIQQNDLDKVLTNFLKEREESKNSNRYDMNAMQTLILEGYNRTEAENFEDIINAITTKDIQEIAKKLLKNKKSYEVVFKPQQ
ncbi:M16 family metallopeptidase [Algibacter sp. Ld11]|uniref:M16 family metallopeptidase n=1 Tax=Algibacter sp. Ld11 TaxID=649150 RepID=UPI00386F38FA